jgi:hypothetical protein
MKKILIFLLIAVVLFIFCNKVTDIAGGGDVVTTGHVFYSDGAPASECKVTAIPSNSIPSSASAISQYVTITDSNGKYSLILMSDGSYNIYCTKDSLISYIPEITFGNSDTNRYIPNDTLKLSGSIKGVVKLSDSEDSRIVLILGIGGMIVTGPDDSCGNYYITNIAEGKHTFRFLATGNNYNVLDTVIYVTSGKTTVIDSIILTKSSK